MSDIQPDAPLKRDAGSSRAPRAMSDRAVTEDRGKHDEFLQRFRMQAYTNALPNLPEIDGYHCIWLTSTNPADPLHEREMLGYEPIAPEDAPNLSTYVGKDGDFAGRIMVREMVAYKIPEELYQAYMRVRHHEEPLAMEETIRTEAERAGANMGADDIDDIDDVRQLAPAPRRFD